MYMYFLRAYFGYIMCILFILGSKNSDNFDGITLIPKNGEFSLFINCINSDVSYVFIYGSKF